MDCSPPGSSAHGILQAECWSGLLCPPPGDLPDLGIEPRSPAWQADFLPSRPPGKPFNGRLSEDNAWKPGSMLIGSYFYCCYGAFLGAAVGRNSFRGTETWLALLELTLRGIQGGSPRHG